MRFLVSAPLKFNTEGILLVVLCSIERICALISIQTVNQVNVFIAEVEVEHIDVLSESLFVDRFWDDDNSPLQHPANDNLCDRLVVFCSNVFEDRVFQ